MKKIVLIVIALMLSACTSLKVVKLDPKTGLFPTKKEATVITNTPLNLDERKALVLVPNAEFDKDSIKNIGYFDQVITSDDLETLVVQNNLGEKVPSIKGRIGINNAAKHYKSFLWLRYDTRGSRPKQYAQLILTDPLTLEDIFVAETYMDYLWSGVNDQSNWYPMFNSLIEYIKKNSRTYN